MEPVDEIYGVWDKSMDWAPKEIIVKTAKGDESYDFLERGGGGLIYKSGDKVLKVIHSPRWLEEGDKGEMELQEQSGELAPKIFYHSKQKVKCKYVEDDTEKPDMDKDGWVSGGSFNNEDVEIIIMEYLHPKEWIPLAKNKTTFNSRGGQILEFVYKLVFEKGLKNPTDFLGYTGDHLFLNRRDNRLKVVDFGFFEISKDNRKDFMKMMEDIDKHIYNRMFSDEDKECYKIIVDLDTKLTPACKNIKFQFILQARGFLENKLKPSRKTKQKVSHTRYEPYSRTKTLLKKKKPKQKKKTKKQKKQTKNKGK